MGRIRETTMGSVIFRASNSWEEVQSLKGQGAREVTRNQRERTVRRGPPGRGHVSVSTQVTPQRMPGE